MEATAKKLIRGYLDEVVESGIFSGMRVSVPTGGRFVQLVEQEFRQLFQVDHALSFNSATSALYAALVALGVGSGDGVLVPAITMSASGAAVVHAGANLYLVDVDRRTGLVTLDTIREAYTMATQNGFGTPQAMVIVHLFGQVVDVDKVREEFPDLKIVEDCAQAPGCVSLHRRFAGTMGEIGVFSLNQDKVITCGEGGIAITDSNAFAEKLMLLRNHGENYSKLIVGHNYRMTEPEAAIAYAEVAHLMERQTRYREASQTLSKLLVESQMYRPMEVTENISPYIYYLWSNSLELHGVPAGWRHGYSKPLCCIPGLRTRLHQDHPCMVGAHEFDSRIIVRKPPGSLEEAEKIAAELLETEVQNA